MDQPLFSDSQFLDQNALNTAFGLSYSSAQQITDLTNSPGLINPASLTITPATLNLNVSAPSPFAVLFGNGALATANGTTDGSLSSSYVVNLAPLVPGSGGVVVYLVATFAQVHETSYEVIGPPSGHPDFSPTFAPYQAYSDTKDTLAITAITTIPDNVTTFELCRTTLTAGQTSITTIDTTHRVLASSLLAPTGVNAGSYAGATVTVGVDGRITGIVSVAYGPLAGTNIWTGVNTFVDKIIASIVQTASATLSFIGGTAGINFANNANNAINLSIADNGNVGVRGGLTTASVATDTIDGRAGATLDLIGGTSGWQITNHANSAANLNGDDAGNVNINRGTLTQPGVRGLGNSATPNLNDFTVVAPGPNACTVMIANGVIDVVFTTSVTVTSSIFTTNVLIPTAFPSFCFDSIVCFGGNTPPAGAGIAAQPVDKFTIAITTNGGPSSGTGTLGVVIRARGI